jgi:hypothetical protein
MDIIGKMTLEGNLKKRGMIGMITPESFSKLLGILGDKEKSSNQMNSFTQKNRIGISVAMQDTFRSRQGKKHMNSVKLKYYKSGHN